MAGLALLRGFAVRPSRSGLAIAMEIGPSAIRLVWVLVRA